MGSPKSCKTDIIPYAVLALVTVAAMLGSEVSLSEIQHFSIKFQVTTKVLVPIELRSSGGGFSRTNPIPFRRLNKIFALSVLSMVLLSALEGAVSGLQEEPVMLGIQMNVFLGFILATNCQAKQHLR